MNTKTAHNDVYEAIYEIVRRIPKGRVSTYGDIAAAIGLRSGARMVGYAMNHSHTVRPKVPAHRVVNRSGLLSGKHHFGAPDAMEKLLKKEGIAVENDQVQHFEALRWNPATELSF
jgi:methylated-DNA-protein-cysteine methyltransferase related protein